MNRKLSVLTVVIMLFGLNACYERLDDEKDYKDVTSLVTSAGKKFRRRDGGVDL
jgi:hypothetical protein